VAARDGDGWVQCDCGNKHWGLHGAAGLLLVRDSMVLLQHRAPWVHNGDTWGIPGGARDSHEDVIQGALREAVEELFHVSDVDPRLINRLSLICKPITTIVQGGYVIVVYDFHTLTTFLKIVCQYDLYTPLYDELPLTVSDLILNRRVHPKAEISHLVLVPLVHHSPIGPFIHHEFLADMTQIKSVIST
jgi:hypothetical protein